MLSSYPFYSPDDQPRNISRKLLERNSTTHMLDSDIDQLLENSSITANQAEILRQVTDRRTALIREIRFTYDSTLFRLARVLQSLTVFQTLLPKNTQELLSQTENLANGVISDILRNLDYHCLEPIQPGESFNEKVKSITELHNQIVAKIKRALTIDNKPGIPMGDFYGLGQAELLYRHRYSNQFYRVENEESKQLKLLESNGLTLTGIIDVDQKLNHIYQLLMQNIGINGTFEEGKLGLANETLDPEQKQYSVCEHTYEDRTVLHITRTKKFHPYATDDIKHTTLTPEILAEYLYIYKNFTLANDYQVKQIDQNNREIKEPFWFADLPRVKKYYLVADLQKMAQEAKAQKNREVMNTELTELDYFKKRIDEKYSNTTAKGRQLPGLASLRQKTDLIYQKDADGNYQLIYKNLPEIDEFTSAGSPTHLRSKSKTRDKTSGKKIDHDGQIQFTARNIAMALPSLIKKRHQWIKKTFGDRIDSKNITAYFFISSLVSPLKGQAWLFRQFAKIIEYQGNEEKSDIIRENNEGMIVKTLKKALEYMSNLSARGELDFLNSELKNLEDADGKKINYKIIFDLAILSINNLGTIDAIRANKSTYMTATDSLTHALAEECELFLTHWEQFCQQQNITTDISLASTEAKDAIQKIKDALIQLSDDHQSTDIHTADFTQLENACQELSELLNNQLKESNARQPLYELVNKTEAFITYLQTRQLTLSTEQKAAVEKQTEQRSKKNPAIKPPMLKDNSNIITAAIFEEAIPELAAAILPACKSHHDRAEHKASIKEVLKIAEALLGRYPDPSNPKHYQLLIKIFIKEKFIAQSLSRAREMSSNTPGLKSHDSVDLKKAFEWAQRAIIKFAKESGIISDQLVNAGSRTDQRKIIAKLNVPIMIKEFTAAAIDSDFLKKTTVAEDEATSDTDDAELVCYGDDDDPEIINPLISQVEVAPKDSFEQQSFRHTEDLRLTTTPSNLSESRNQSNVSARTLELYKDDSERNAPAQDAMIMMTIADLPNADLVKPSVCNPTEYQLLRKHLKAIANHSRLSSMLWVKVACIASVDALILYPIYFEVLHPKNIMPSIIHPILDLGVLACSPAIVYYWKEIIAWLEKTGHYDNAKSFLTERSVKKNVEQLSDVESPLLGHNRVDDPTTSTQAKLSFDNLFLMLTRELHISDADAASIRKNYFYGTVNPSEKPFMLSWCKLQHLTENQTATKLWEVAFALKVVYALIYLSIITMALYSPAKNPSNGSFWFTVGILIVTGGYWLLHSAPEQRSSVARRISDNLNNAMNGYGPDMLHIDPIDIESGNCKPVVREKKIEIFSWDKNAVTIFAENSSRDLSERTAADNSPVVP